MKSGIDRVLWRRLHSYRIMGCFLCVKGCAAGPHSHGAEQGRQCMLIFDSIINCRMNDSAAHEDRTCWDAGASRGSNRPPDDGVLSRCCKHKTAHNLPKGTGKEGQAVWHTDTPCRCAPGRIRHWQRDLWSVHPGESTSRGLCTTPHEASKRSRRWVTGVGHQNHFCTGGGGVVFDDVWFVQSMWGYHCA